MPFLTQGPEGEQAPHGVNKTNRKFLLIVIVLAAIVGGGTWFLLKTASEELIKSEKEIILIGPLGDFVPSDIENECNEQLEVYFQSTEFEDRGFSECSIVESKESLSPEECQFVPPLAGCYICILKCK